MTSRYVARSIVVLFLGIAAAQVSAQEHPWGLSGRRWLPDPTPPKHDKAWLERLEAWSDALERHRPGEVDASLRAIADLTTWDVQNVLEDFLQLRQRLASPRRPLPARITYKDRTVDAAVLLRMPAFLVESRLERNRVLRRAALLHADVALLAPVDVSARTGASDSVVSVDGTVVGFESQSGHWPAGRRLLDAIEPSPTADRFVALWYRATLASLLEMGNLIAAEHQVEHGLTVLPDDSGMNLAAGILRQANATTAVQATARMMRANTTRFTGVTVKDAAANLQAAERFLRRALTLDANCAEARMRLGQVLADLNRVEEGAAELRRAAKESADDRLSYLSNLLLGDAEERLGHADAAIRCYAEAERLFPNARSPRFARAALARRRGERARAWDIVKNSAAPPRVDQIDADPWWTIDRRQIRPAAALVQELRASIGEGAGR
jgi:tetratricopeptide (TPR) repeat protein